VPVRLDTVELLELVDLLDRYPHEQAARKAREEENRDWWRSWADARRRLRGTGERKARLSAALWCFGLIGERYGPRYNAHRIAFEYHQLIEGYFDPATQTHYPPIEPCEACQILRQRHGNPSADAVRKLLQRHGVRGLPSVC
jgi:hypothetical protein